MSAIYLFDGFTGDEVYVEQSSGLFHVVGEDGEHWSRVCVPEAAVELLDPAQAREVVIDEVRAALAGVSMSKTARAAVAAALDDLIGDEA